MLRFSVTSAALAILVAMAGSAQAQTTTPGISPFPLGGKSKFSRTNKPGTINLSVSYRFFVEGDANSIEEQAELSEQGRRAVYALLGRECDALLETIAEDCTIKHANVSSQINSSRRRTSRSQAGVRVSGSATYQITLKKARKSGKSGKSGTE